MSGPVPHLRLSSTVAPLRRPPHRGGHVGSARAGAGFGSVLRDAAVRVAGAVAAAALRVSSLLAASARAGWRRLPDWLAMLWSRRVVSLSLLLLVASAAPLAVTAPAPVVDAALQTSPVWRSGPQVLEFTVADLASPPQPPGEMPAPRFDLTDLTPVQRQVADRLIVLGRGSEFVCLGNIFTGESSWRAGIVAPDTGGVSYGLGQRHGPTWGPPPLPWPVDDQVDWFVAYADSRYGGMCPAWREWERRAAARAGRGWW